MRATEQIPVIKGKTGDAPWTIHHYESRPLRTDSGKFPAVARQSNLLRRLSRIIDHNAINDCTPLDIDMASITIRNLDDETKNRLRIRAAHRRRSMEDEARNILRETLARDSTPPGNLAKAIAKRFKPLGGVDLDLPVREEIREPPAFDS
jgi:antitoxin FitA